MAKLGGDLLFVHICGKKFGNVAVQRAIQFCTIVEGQKIAVAPDREGKNCPLRHFFIVYVAGRFEIQ